MKTKNKLEAKFPLKEFSFFQDAKNTVWIRYYYKIKATSKEEAIKRLEEYKEYLIIDTAEDGTDIIFEESETLFDTYAELSIEGNNASTIETYIYDENSSNPEFLWDNEDFYYEFLIGKRFHDITHLINYLEIVRPTPVITAQYSNKTEDIEGDYYFILKVDFGNIYAKYKVTYIKDNKDKLYITGIEKRFVKNLQK